MDADLNGNIGLAGNARRDAQRDGQGDCNANSFRALPDEAPLAMPTQSLAPAPRNARGRPASSPRGIGARRLLVIGGAIALSVAGDHEMYLVLGRERLNAAGGRSCCCCSWRCSPGSPCRSPARSPASSRCWAAADGV